MSDAIMELALNLKKRMLFGLSDYTAADVAYNLRNALDDCGFTITKVEPEPIESCLDKNAFLTSLQPRPLQTPTICPSARSPMKTGALP